MIDLTVEEALKADLDTLEKVLAERQSKLKLYKDFLCVEELQELLELRKKQRLYNAGIKLFEWAKKRKRVTSRMVSQSALAKKVRKKGGVITQSVIEETFCFLCDRGYGDFDGEFFVANQKVKDYSKLLDNPEQSTSLFEIYV